jgi:hypothetical protein
MAAMTTTTAAQSLIATRPAHLQPGGDRPQAQALSPEPRDHRLDPRRAVFGRGPALGLGDLRRLPLPATRRLDAQLGLPFCANGQRSAASVNNCLSARTGLIAFWTSSIAPWQRQARHIGVRGDFDHDCPRPPPIAVREPCREADQGPVPDSGAQSRRHLLARFGGPLSLTDAPPRPC